MAGNSVYRRQIVRRPIVIPLLAAFLIWSVAFFIERAWANAAHVADGSPVNTGSVTCPTVGTSTVTITYAPTTGNEVDILNSGTGTSADPVCTSMTTSKGDTCSCFSEGTPAVSTAVNGVCACRSVVGGSTVFTCNYANGNAGGSCFLGLQATEWSGTNLGPAVLDTNGSHGQQNVTTASLATGSGSALGLTTDYSEAICGQVANATLSSGPNGGYTSSGGSANAYPFTMFSGWNPLVGTAAPATTFTSNTSSVNSHCSYFAFLLGSLSTPTLTPTPTLTATPTPIAPAHWIYMGDGDGVVTPVNQIDMFSTGDTGNLSPRGVLNSSSFFGASALRGLAFDTSGNLWVADKIVSKVYEFDHTLFPLGGTITPAANHFFGGASTTLSAPHGISFDGSGNLWVANYSASTIVQFSAAQVASVLAGGTGNLVPNVTLTALAASNPTQVRLDSSGRIWVANGSLFVFPIGATGATARTFSVSGNYNGLYDFQFTGLNTVWATGGASGSGYAVLLDASACTTGACVVNFSKQIDMVPNFWTTGINIENVGNIWLSNEAYSGATPVYTQNSGQSLGEFGPDGTAEHNFVGSLTTFSYPHFVEIGATVTITPTATSTATPAVTWWIP